MIGIAGSGSWATALSQVLCDNQIDNIIWGRNIAEVNDINFNHRNNKYFDCLLNNNLKATTDFSILNQCDIVLLATPVIAFEEILNNLHNLLDHPVYIINVSKGFYYQNNERLSVVIKNSLNDKCIDVISLIGPSHAEEVVKRLNTAVNSVCENEEYALKVQNLFSNNYFRVYRNTDVIGAELSAAIKNVMAIASGILVGLGQGDNCRAALMTRGLAEMSRFVLYFGGKEKTLLGLNGVGDLIVTCSSIHSRNYQAGLMIGKNDGAEYFFKNNTMTVEGINTTKAVYEISRDNHIEMPITTEMYKILFENKKPSSAIIELMSRSLKKEDN